MSVPQGKISNMTDTQEAENNAMTKAANNLAQLTELRPRSTFGGASLAPGAATYRLTPPYDGVEFVTIGAMCTPAGKTLPMMAWSAADGVLIDTAYAHPTSSHQVILDELGYRRAQ